ncbi:MAG: sulfatase-like hydrolase/transferase [Alphaproteobacteria bacterium]|nr:sulfatase-like hydrolase/transferase [Alphaproteobacteria bacterium]
MVMTDQHAARVMGCAGDDFAMTPGLDRLAKSGVRFENFYCNSPLCVPSRTAFLTGLEPHHSGVLNNDNYLASDIPTIAHALGDAGYDCHLVGRMHFYGPDQTHGFASRPIGDIGANYPGGAPPDIGTLNKARGNHGPELEFSGPGETSYQAYDLAVAAQAQATLEKLMAQRAATGRPFFILISLFCPHPPYIARKKDYQPFYDSLPGPRIAPPAKEHPAIAQWRRVGKVADLSDNAIKTSRAAYYGLVHMIDRIAGRIFDTVAARANTVSIYTSDHGECLGERGLWWKSVMYDQSTKVPLIVRAPGIKAGTTDTRVTSLFDLSASILSFGEAKPLPGQRGRGLGADGPWPDTCTSSFYGGLMNIDTGDVRHRMVRVGDHKLVWFDGHAPLLFNLASDPDELVNLADLPASQSVLADLTRQLLEDWCPERIAGMQVVQAARVDVIRDWVRATSPPETARWVDPDPTRNAYETGETLT